MKTISPINPASTNHDNQSSSLDSNFSGVPNSGTAGVNLRRLRLRRLRVLDEPERPLRDRDDDDEDDRERLLRRPEWLREPLLLDRREPSDELLSESDEVITLLHGRCRPMVMAPIEES